MSRQTRSLAEEWDKLEAQLRLARPMPPSPATVPLTRIRMWPGVFQHRSTRGLDGEAHVRELATAIKKSSDQTVAAITVWWDGKGWACVDGHHRVDAYRLANVGQYHPVPVQVFAGSLAQAAAEAASANTKDKLQMSRGEKTNTAWRLVATTTMSIQETAAVAAVAPRTVANMRVVLKALKARQETHINERGFQFDDDYRNLTWEQAKRLASGQEAPDFDRDAANEAKAREMALALRKALGKEGGKYPEILARALDIYDTRLKDRLLEWWSEEEESSDAEDAQQAEATSDF